MEIYNLINLGKKTIKLFQKYKQDKDVKPSIMLYIKHSFSQLKISEKDMAFKEEPRIIQKPDWTIIIYNFIKEVIEPMEEFIKITQMIAKNYKENINVLAQSAKEVEQSKFFLGNFLKKLIQDNIENKLTESSIVEYASLFKSELELSKTEYNYVYYLADIFVQDDSIITINDNTLIRKITASDLEYTSDLLDYTRKPRFLGYPFSILEIKMYIKEEKEIQEYSDRILKALRLFKLGSVYTTEIISNKKTIIWPVSTGSHFLNQNYLGFKTYTIKSSETDSFINAVNLFEQNLNFNKEEKKFWGLNISIDRYNSALLEYIDYDRKLMTAVMGLESLFSLGNEIGENSYKLGIRVAKLLGNSNFNAEEVRENTEKAYRFRNKIVHGLYISNNDRKKINILFPSILNYLRVSLIIFILNKDVGKEEIIRIIDKSTISEYYNKELKKFIKKIPNESSILN